MLLWDVMSQPNVDCQNPGQIWLGITDNQEEGHYLNIKSNFYEDVFDDYDTLVGIEIGTETRWSKFQPNGGVTENCGVTSSYRDGWSDKPCEMLRCVACSIRANRLFHLRGLCRLTK